MSDYTSTFSKITGQTVESSDFSTEFDAIEVASATKADKSGDTLTTTTLTSPKINEILDNNGNEELIFTTTASAVNEITVANAAAGNAPSLTQSGAGNVGIDIEGVNCKNGSVIFDDGEGLDFSAYTDGSVAGTTTSQVLLDYEEGTFTPVLGDGTRTVDSARMDVEFGSYTKIGDMVTIFVNVESNDIATDSINGDMEISGLPYTSANVTAQNGCLAVGNASGLNIISGQAVAAKINKNQSKIVLKVFNATTGTANLTHTAWTDDGGVQLTGSYKV